MKETTLISKIIAISIIKIEYAFLKTPSQEGNTLSPRQFSSDKSNSYIPKVTPILVQKVQLQYTKISPWILPAGVAFTFPD